MNKLILLLFLIISNFTQSQNSIYLENNDSIIIWNRDRKLNWKDFKETNVDPCIYKNNPISAGSDVGLTYTSKSKNKRIECILVYSLFYKKSSYGLLKTDYLLEHEQLHFDIAELFARKIRKEFLLLKQKNAIYDDYISTFDRINKDFWHYQDLYDLETLHSENKEKQQEWNKKINNELKEMEKYSFGEYKIKFGCCNRLE